jgi:hypothetical protein
VTTKDSLDASLLIDVDMGISQPTVALFHERAQKGWSFDVLGPREIGLIT